MAKQYDKKFKEDALQYRKDHLDLPIAAVCRNLGISQPTFYNWQNKHERMMVRLIILVVFKII